MYERYLEAHSRRVDTVPGQVAELMVTLAGAETVLDPVCGLGSLSGGVQPRTPLRRTAPPGRDRIRRSRASDRKGHMLLGLPDLEPICVDVLHAYKLTLGVTPTFFSPDPESR